jgi:hypothetical protein
VIIAVHAHEVEEPYTVFSNGRHSDGGNPPAWIAARIRFLSQVNSILRISICFAAIQDGDLKVGAMRGILLTIPIPPSD